MGSIQTVNLTQTLFQKQEKALARVLTSKMSAHCLHATWKRHSNWVTIETWKGLIVEMIVPQSQISWTVMKWSLKRALWCSSETVMSTVGPWRLQHPPSRSCRNGVIPSRTTYGNVAGLVQDRKNAGDPVVLQHSVLLGQAIVDLSNVLVTPQQSNPPRTCGGAAATSQKNTTWCWYLHGDANIRHWSRMRRVSSHEDCGFKSRIDVDVAHRHTLDNLPKTSSDVQHGSSLTAVRTGFTWTVTIWKKNWSERPETEHL